MNLFALQSLFSCLWHSLPWCSSMIFLQCSPAEFCLVVRALHRVHRAVTQTLETVRAELKSKLLNHSLGQIPNLLSDISNYSEAISEQAARYTWFLRLSPSAFNNTLGVPKLIGVVPHTSWENCCSIFLHINCIGKKEVNNSYVSAMGGFPFHWVYIHFACQAYCVLYVHIFWLWVSCIL